MADTEIAGLVVQMKADLSDYVTKLAQMESQTNKTSDQISANFEKVSKAMAAAGVAMGAFAATAVKSAMDWGTAVNSVSRQTGMSAEETSKFLVVAKRAGIDIDSARVMFARFAVNITQAGDAMEKASANGRESSDSFSKLGISVRNTDGSYRSVSELFGEVRDKLSGMENGAEKTSIQMDLFGRSGYQLAGLMGMTSEEIQQTIDKAQTLGLILSGEQATAWATAGKEIKDVKQTLTAVGITIGNELLPYIKQGTDELTNITRAFVSMDTETKNAIISTVKLGAEIGIAATVINRVTGAIGGATEALGLMRAATLAAAGPWIALASAIAIATSALLDYMDNKNKVQWYKDAEVYDDPDRPGLHTKKEWSDEAGVTELGTTTGGYIRVPLSEAEEEKFQNKKQQRENGPEPPAPPAVPDYSSYGGGNGGGPSGGSGSQVKEQSELEKYLKQMQEALSLEEKRYQLGQVTREELDQMLYDQQEGLKDVEASEDEQNRKEMALLDIESKHIQLVKDKKKEDQAYWDQRAKEAEEDAQRIDKEFQTQIRQVSELVEKQQQAAKKTKDAWDDVFVGILSGDVDGKSIGKSLQRELANLLVKGESTLFGVSKKSTTKVDGFTDDQNKALQTFIGTIGAGTDAMTILNGVTQILGMTTKPAETAATTASTAAKLPETTATTAHTAATTASTAAITAMSAAATAAAAALASVGGGEVLGLFEGGGIVPSAAGGMITGDSGFGARNNIPAVLHPREMVLPKNISSMFIDLAQTYRANTGGRRQYNSINIYNAQNLNENKLVSKLGRRINNLQRGSR